MIKPLVFPFLPSQVERYQDERGWLVRPDSTESLQQVIRQCGVTHTQLYPEWGMSSLPPQALLLDMGALNHVIRLRPEELMVTVQTGITVGDLQTQLHSAGYVLPRLASDSRPLYDILAHTPFSLSETQQGPWTSSVTGLRAVVGDGQSIHYGGEVVKNVTGYDLRHLFLGSHHQFGICTQVTLKIRPLPEQTHTLLFFCETVEDALQRFTQMGHLGLAPDVLALFRTKTTFGWHIMAQVSGYRESVHEKAQRLAKLGEGLAQNLQNLDAGDKTMAHWVPRLDWSHPEEPDSLVVRVALAPMALLSFTQWYKTFPWLDGADVQLAWGVGQMHLRWIAVNMPYAEELEAFQKFIRALGGFVQVLRLPPQYPFNAGRYNQDPQPALQTWKKRLQALYNPHNTLPLQWPDIYPSEESL